MDTFRDKIELVEKQPDPAAFKRICSHFVQASGIPTIERLGLLEPALQEATYLVRTDPSNPRRWALLGAILLELRRGPGALEAFQRARILEPEDRSYERLTRMVDSPRVGLRVPRADLDALTGM